ncbi:MULTISPECIES: hypothetical protein [unclassified Streptomyces]|uniref:hypothetical protein n=1 Tax=unclassified Streptomyces TaxID=2593676 RepID=UPI00224E3A64|nr:MULTISPECIES: hypothetical protein [unclassified Streptomyces]MCX4524405.1 hypothetical protein [Streptomyces sp. NBC_01551]MCX4545072.1 hypothetical protein [Streptomyces sp. NBC_01565]
MRFYRLCRLIRRQIHAGKTLGSASHNVRVSRGLLRTTLIVGAATRFDRDVQAAFTACVQLRHHEVTNRTGRTEESSALGVLLTQRHDGRRPWDTSTVRVHGDLELPPEDLQIHSEAWNRALDKGDAIDQDRAEQPPAPTGR